MITKIIDILAAVVIGVIGYLGYAGIFLLMLVESCGVPMPSEVIMPFSGFLVYKGQLALWVVIIVGTLGNLVGSLLAYWIGYRGGRPLIEKYGKYILISKHDLDLADRWFSKYGQFTVFFGRLLPVVRTYISFPAGIAKMDLKKFSLYTFLGAFLWSWLFAWLGIKMGANWEQIRATLHNFDLAIAIGILVLIALYVWRHIRNRKRHSSTV
ncbi:MAG: DedA family protein [Candidatus Magasanikbacteria bacterium]|nr:DedA family protein [Candidatus Magasanikbacteria bacterium]